MKYLQLFVTITLIASFSSFQISLTSPTGLYEGTSSVLGNKVSASMQIVDATHVDVKVTVSGLTDVKIDCKGEGYTLSGSNVSLTGLSDPSDCLSKALAKYTVSIKSILYNSNKDNMEFKVHKIVDISIELDHKSESELLTGPSGLYEGSSSVLGNKVEASVNIVDATHADVKVTVSGLTDVKIDCSGEGYTLSGSNINLTGLSDPSDCLSKALAKYTVSIKSILYDANKDTCEFKVHKILDISIELDHQSEVELLTGPSGEYDGKTSVIGNKVNAEVNVLDDSHTDIMITVSGLISVKINCKKEEYTMSGSKITLSGLSNPSDCVAEALSKNGVTLKSITYDAKTDSIDLKVHKIVDIDIHLTHKSQLGELEALMIDLYMPYFDIEVIIMPELFYIQSPSGSYCGAKDVIGAHFTNKLIFESADKAEFIVKSTGIIVSDVDCKSEAISVDANTGAVSLPTSQTKGDCIHDNLEKMSTTIKQMSYDSQKDSFSITFHKFIDIDITLTKC